MLSVSDEDKHYASKESKDEEGTGNSARLCQNFGIISAPPPPGGTPVTDTLHAVTIVLLQQLLNLSIHAHQSIMHGACQFVCTYHRSRPCLNTNTASSFSQNRPLLGPLLTHKSNPFPHTLCISIHFNNALFHVHISQLIYVKNLFLMLYTARIYLPPAYCMSSPTHTP
jgi:hypothetical protein